MLATLATGSLGDQILGGLGVAGAGVGLLATALSSGTEYGRYTSILGCLMALAIDIGILVG
jgi:hypothetical protein